MPYQLPCLRHLSIEAGEKRRGVDEQVDSKKARVNDESRVFGLLVYEIDRDIMFIVEIAASLTRERIATRLIVEALIRHDTVKHVQLIVKKDNDAALSLYKKLGFEETSLVETHKPEDYQFHMTVTSEYRDFDDWKRNAIGEPCEHGIRTSGIHVPSPRKLI
jgi:ribosomal protein S18 acetylase RimI-like enzyme